MSIVVFLGPTLPHATARALLDATYLPPAAMGDVYACLRRAPRAIVIVDGVFERTPAVWHKEILFALSRGVRVFGASSMGALRAAELAPFGMEGHGRIFEMFASGALEDDDEVAVAHGPAESGFRAGSDAMVNLRHGLELARRGGVVSIFTREVLERAAKETFYADRSWATLFARAPSLGVPAEEIDRLRAFIRAEKPDLKRRDAIELLEHVALVAPDLARHEPRFGFESSFAWRRLVAEETRVGAAGVPAEALARRVRATAPDRHAILRGAAELALAAEEARRRTGHEPSIETDFDHACAALEATAPEEVSRWVHVELARRGILDDVADAVAAHAHGPAEGDDAVRAWYEARFGAVEGDLDAHAASLGFTSWSALAREVEAEMRVAVSRSS